MEYILEKVRDRDVRATLTVLAMAAASLTVLFTLVQ